MNDDNKVETNDFTATAILKDIALGNTQYHEKYDINASGIIDIPDLDYIKDWLFTEPEKQLTPVELVKVSDKTTYAVYGESSNAATRSTDYEYDKAGNLIKETDCNGNFISYEYDDNNRLISITDKEGAKTRLFYDEAGNRIKEVLPENYNATTDDGPGTTYIYDTMNRLIQVKNAQGEVVSKNIYDISGRILKAVDAAGFQSASTDSARYGVEYTYDIGNRIKTTTTPRAKELAKTSESYIYDALNNVINLTDGEGNTTTYERDLWGRVTKLTDAKSVDTLYTYDNAGNLTSVTDGNLHTTTYKYNSLNLLSQIIDDDGQNITYKYDKEGRRALEIDRNGQVIHYNFNSDSNITEKSIAGKAENEKYLYNKDGSLLAAINKTGVDRYEYTPNGYVKKKIRNGKLELEYQYNKNGSVTGVTDITGGSTNYSYDTIGRLKTVSDGSNPMATYGYNTDNTMASVDYNTGIKVAYGYDKDKNVTSLINRNPQGGIIGSYNYTYDNNSNQLSKTENDQTTTYTYDKLNRLESAQYPQIGLESYTYDNAGNRLTKTQTGNTTNYTYDNLNRLMQSEENGIVTSYGYDNNGNLLNENTGDKTKTYTYDGYNRQTGVNNPDGSYQLNEYNAFGLRVAAVENGLRHDFVYDRGNVIAEINGKNEVESRYIRGIKLIAQKEGDGSLNYYLRNAHGDVTNLVSGNGEVLNSYTYDAFGNIMNQTETVDNRFKYAGEQFDNIAGQYYLRARFYNPTIGRFISEDTYRGSILDPMSLNLYTYCANNPVLCFLRGINKNTVNSNKSV